MFFHKRSAILVALLAGLLVSSSYAAGPTFSVSFPKSRSEKPLDGRIFLLLSTDPSAEPRMQIDDSVRTQMMFGMDVDAMHPGQAVIWTIRPMGIPFAACATCRRETTTCRRCCIATKPSTAPTATRSSCPWTAAKGSTGTSRPAISTPLRARSRWDRPPDGRDRARPGNPAHPAAAGHPLHPAHQDSERAADQVLGAAHVPQRQRAGARGI